jgi:hypothetical protein
MHAGTRALPNPSTLRAAVSRVARQRGHAMSREVVAAAVSRVPACGHVDAAYAAHVGAPTRSRDNRGDARPTLNAFWRRVP